MGKFLKCSLQKVLSNICRLFVSASTVPNKVLFLEPAFQPVLSSLAQCKTVLEAPHHQECASNLTQCLVDLTVNNSARWPLLVSKSDP